MALCCTTCDQFADQLFDPIVDWNGRKKLFVYGVEIHGGLGPSGELTLRKLLPLKQLEFQ